MRIAARVIGWLAWLTSGLHMVFAGYHDWRSAVHARRKAAHDSFREGRIEEAARIEAAASTLAPRKPKAPKSVKQSPAVSPPARSAPLAALVEPRTGDDPPRGGVVSLAPRVFAHGGNDE